MACPRRAACSRPSPRPQCMPPPRSPNTVFSSVSHCAFCSFLCGIFSVGLFSVSHSIFGSFSLSYLQFHTKSLFFSFLLCFHQFLTVFSAVSHCAFCSFFEKTFSHSVFGSFSLSFLLSLTQFFSLVSHCFFCGFSLICFFFSVSLCFLQFLTQFFSSLVSYCVFCSF